MSFYNNLCKTILCPLCEKSNANRIDGGYHCNHCMKMYHLCGPEQKVVESEYNYNKCTECLNHIILPPVSYSTELCNGIINTSLKCSSLILKYTVIGISTGITTLNYLQNNLSYAYKNIVDIGLLNDVTDLMLNHSSCELKLI